MIGPGTIVDGYQLTRQLGEGPFGLVFHGKDIRRGSVAALKLLRPHIVSQPMGKQTFGRLVASIKAYSELVHPNLAGVHRTVQDQDHGAFGLALDFIDGQSLDRMQLPLVAKPDARTIDPKRLGRLLGWFEQLARVMAWLHARGVVHGNLKPTNVMLLPGPGDVQVKVLDLCWSAIGVARPPPGTETFLSPEQLEGVPPTAASDGWTVAEMLHRAMTAGARELALSPASGVPPQLVTLLDRARRRDPAQRVKDLGEMGDVLHAVRLSLEDEPTDRRTEALRANAVAAARAAAAAPTTPIAAPPAATVPVPVVTGQKAAQPAPLEFADEPATVKVPISAHGGRPIPQPSIVDRDVKAKGRSTGDLALERDTLEPGDLALDVKAEPSLALDSLTLPPEAGLSPALVKKSEARKISPLALWGTGLLVVAVALVLGTARWFKAKTSIATEPLPVASAGVNERRATDASPSAAATEPKRAPEEAAKGADASAVAEAKTEPKTEAKTEPVTKPGITRVPEVALRPEEPAPKKDKPQPKSVESPRGAAPGGARALDAKADEAMAKLAALSGGDAEKTAQGAAKTDDPKHRYEVSCDEGDGTACLALGNAWRADSSAARSDEKARAAFERACTFKSGEGCHRAATMLKEGRGGAADEARAKELEARACKLGRTWSCRAETETSSKS